MQRFGTTSVDLARGDITRESVDAIVNAANSSLLGGGGVDGAIHRAGGPAILDECRKIRDQRGSLPAGEAVITGAGRLPCRRVIHTVGPVWQDGRHGEPETLARCYRNCLALAADQGQKSVAFPSISTGVFGYPVAEAARVALETVTGVLRAGSPLAQVRFILFSDSDLAVYRAALERL